MGNSNDNGPSEEEWNKMMGIQPQEDGVVEDNTTPVEEVQPVNFGKKLTGFIIIGFILVLMIIIFVVASRVTSRDENSGQNSNTSEIGISSSGSVAGSTTEDVRENSEKTTVSDGSVSSGSVQSSTGEENGSVTPEVTVEPKATPEASENDFHEVSEPSLGEVGEVSSMISAKRVYKINGNSYVYGIELVVLRKDGDADKVMYFCPRGTYDALQVGDSVRISYQMDSEGSISIVSMSR